LGKMIECPTCGKPTEVTHARGARTATQVVSSVWWVKAICQGYCGAVLRRVAELVTVMPESIPKPVVKSLGACVGRVVLCPGEVRLPDGSARPCGREARAAWDTEQAHHVVCPDCGVRAYSGAILVEVVA
jgi:DNA-directed RNA polymerase subunit RPC12/RpoP